MMHGCVGTQVSTKSTLMLIIALRFVHSFKNRTGSLVEPEKPEPIVC
jgi:hypothetical protein